MQNTDKNHRQNTTPLTSTRMSPEDRKSQLITATLICLKKYGFQGTSVRKICTQAGVSPGLISHHYSGKDALVAEAYQTITNQMMDQLNDAIKQNIDQGARQQLTAFFNISFSKQLLDTHLLEAWLAFWGAVKTSEQIRCAHDKSYAEYRAILTACLQRLATEAQWKGFDCELAAIALTAIIEGLWLELGLSPDTFSAKQGILICEAWIDGLISGGYQRLQISSN